MFLIHLFMIFMFVFISVSLSVSIFFLSLSLLSICLLSRSLSLSLSRSVSLALSFSLYLLRTSLALFFGISERCGRILEPGDAAELHRVGSKFCETYIALAKLSAQRGLDHFRLRPKLHAPCLASSAIYLQEVQNYNF